MSEIRERNREATEAKLLEAVGGLIAEEGFGVIGINAIARRANVDKVLIYRYFGGLPGLLSTYAEKGDFWWHVDELLVEPLPGRDDPDGLSSCLSTIFARHAAFLRAHPVTLEVIAWELAQRNELTEALESVRESRSQEMMRRLAARFEIQHTAFLASAGPMFALLGAAANYLAARGRRLRVFNGLDLQSEAGWRKLEGAAARMISGIVDDGLANPPFVDEPHPSVTQPN
jgi:AcrR family transcriptional regulator